MRLFLLALVLTPIASAQTVLYVDVAPPPTGGWPVPLADLQEALAIAQPGDEIWVAEGVYYPTSTTDRSASFVMRSGIELFGGFNGTETSRDERDWEVYPTVLSGDIGIPGDSLDNSVHVVDASGTDRTALLDGFVIQDGRASGDQPEDLFGAGVFAIDGSPTLFNCTIQRNSTAFEMGADSRGAGLYARGGGPRIEDSVFRNNVGGYGSGLYLEESMFWIFRTRFQNNRVAMFFNSNGLFSDNVLEDTGFSALLIADSSPKIRRTVFRNNYAPYGGAAAAWIAGQFASTAPIFTDCLFENNVSEQYAGAVHVQQAAPVFENTVFRNNRALDGPGGAIEVSSATEPLIIGCTFEGNVSSEGGSALHSPRYGKGAVFNSAFYHNASTCTGCQGAAVHIGDPFSGEHFYLANSVFVANRGPGTSAVHIEDADPGEVLLANNTFAYNDEGRTSATVTTRNALNFELTNSILWRNGLPGAPEVASIEGNAPVVVASIVEGGFPGGVGIIDQDPLFVRDPDPGPDEKWGTPDDDYGDLALRAGSPAQDLGLTSVLPIDRWDIDQDGNTTEHLPVDFLGNARIVGASVDAGAFERRAPVAIEEVPPAVHPVLRVSPNPASEHVLVESTAGTVRVFDVLGRVVHTENLTGGRARLDVSAFPPGTYVIRADSMSRLITVLR